MKKVMVLLCALSLLAVPACKRKDAGCAPCNEHVERAHSCNRCNFFGRCADGAERAEHRRYDDAEDYVEVEK